MNSVEDDPKNYVGPSPGRRFVPGLVGAVVLLAAVTAGLVLGRERSLKTQTSKLQEEQKQGPRVLVMPVFQPASSRQLDLPASIHGFIETPVYAKIAGYLDKMNVDKGDHVRKGAVLAVLTSPELDKQVADAKANYWLQQVTYERNVKLVKAEVVAQQTADDSRAAMLRALATYEQLRAMQNYKVLAAPFDGIVTARYVDPGMLIPQATAAGSGTPIVAMASMAPLRVYIDVPQSAALSIRNGDQAQISVYELPGKSFSGPIVRHPEALNAASRTMLVEVDLPNTDFSLYPGMFARASINVPLREGGITVRDDALVFRSGKVFVPVVRASHLHLVPVTLGFDNGQAIEVTGDIRQDDNVALNVGQAAEEGETVQPVELKQ